MAAAAGGSLDTSAPAPRVNFEQMGQLIGKRVKLAGHVGALTGNQLAVKAADEGVVTVLLAGAAPQSQYAEFEGTVESPNTLREESHTDFGAAFGEEREGWGGWVRGGWSSERPCPERRAPPAPAHPRADLGNYNELCKLANGQYRGLFMA